MKIETVSGVVGVVALVMLATTLPAGAEDGSQTSVEEMIPALASPQSTGDRVPNSVGLSDLGDISKESVRYLGGDEVANYWVARSGTSEVCLILEIPGETMAASSCGSITNFYDHGIGLAAGPSVDDPSSSTVAYLLPADIDSNDIGFSKPEAGRLANDLAGELIASRPGESLVRPSSVVRDNGSVFELVPVNIGRG